MPTKTRNRAKNTSNALQINGLEFHSVKQGGLRQQLEGMTVVDGRSILSDGGPVVGRGIALVLGPAILGIVLIELAHEFITVGFGQNRGRRDAEHLAITLDYGGEGDALVRGEAVAVDEDALGAHLQLVQSAVHGKDARPQDVDAVNLLRGAR